MTNLKLAVATGLAAATLAVVLTYVLGAQAILQSPYAEPAHNLFMSMFMPLTKAITTGHSSMSQMHGGGPAAEESTMQGMNQGILGNNILGSPATMPAAGFAAVVVMSVIVLAVAAFVISWKQRSFVVAGLLAAGGIILMILPSANMNFMFPGPVIGLIVGLVIFGLGLTKGIKIARTATVASK
jgi:hypothetical protein